MSSSVYRNSSFKHNQIITIVGRAYAVRFYAQRVRVYSVRGGWRYFHTINEFKAWRMNAFIAFRELDAHFSGEVA